MRLIENGEIVLDGTINKTEKEKIVFRMFVVYQEMMQLINDYQIDFGIIKESLGDYDKYVSLMEDYYKKMVGENPALLKEWKELWVMDHDDFMKVWKVVILGEIYAN